MKKTLTLFIIASMLTKITFAQWTADSTQNTIVRDNSGTEEVTPLMASLPDGSTYVSWFESVNSSYELRMQLLDPNGFALWDPAGLVVSDYTQSSALYRYDLKTDNEGNAIVAFQDTRLGSLNIVAYKLDQAGNFMWSDSGISLTDSLAQEGLSPAIGVTGNNDVIIAWNSDSPANKWISYQKISAEGTMLWNGVQRIMYINNTKKYSRPSILPAGTDDFLMLYVQEVGNFPGVTSTLFTQRFNADGFGVWTSPVQVSTKTIPYFFFPSPVSDGNDGLYLAFNTSNPSNATLNDVYAQHVDDAGNLWSASGTEAANSTINHKTTPGSCFASANGEYWVLLQVLDGSQGSSGVYVQKFDATGNALLGANATELYAISADYYLPYAISNSGDGVIIIYKVGPYGAQKIYAVKIDYSAGFLWSNGSVMLCAVNSNKDDVQAGLFANNDLVVVWDDDRLDFGGVYAQNINSDGTLGYIPTLINDPSSSTDLSLFPNPSSNPQLHFILDKTENVTISIYDVSGKKLTKQEDMNLPPGVHNIEIDGCDLSSGVYFIELRTNGVRKLVKWVKE